MFIATEWEIAFLHFLVILLLFNLLSSQINWLSCQILGISKQALDLTSDGGNLIFFFFFFLQHPLSKMVWSKKLCALEIFEEPNSK